MPAINPLPPYFAEISGYSLAYTAAGEGEPLLLIHGSLCDYRYWRWQIPAFSPHYRVVAPSLRGYWPEAFLTENVQFNIARQCQDLIEFIGQGKQPVHVLGHSRGARIALELACTAPRLVRSLTLADPGFRAEGESGVPAFQWDVLAKLKDGDVEGALSLFVDGVNEPDTWRQMVGWFKTMVKDNAGTLLSQITENEPGFDLNRTTEIQCPVLLLGGANSPARYRQRLDDLEQAMGQSQRTTIPLAAHGMNLANPKAFNERVLQFLDALPRG
jgi:pimeloyl-ACP methyl ester carboxylesterase